MRRSKTEGIVLHRAEVYSSDDYHFLINKDGSIKRLCPQDERGQHAVAYNASTIAVAIFGDFASAEPGQNSKPTLQQLETCVALLHTLNAQYGNTLWAAGHSQLGAKGTNIALKLQPGHTCPGENFPLEELVQASGCRRFYTPVTTSA